MTTTTTDLHCSRLHRYWTALPLCIECDDEGCEECCRCSHCGDRFAEHEIEGWLFFLPEQDLSGTVGWCSEQCLSAYCDAIVTGLGMELAGALRDEWWACHVGDSGLCLTISEWAAVRTDREWRTFVALRGEVARQQRKAHETVTTSTTRANDWCLIGELIANVERLLEEGKEIPDYAQRLALECVDRAKRGEPK